MMVPFIGQYHAISLVYTILGTPQINNLGFTHSPVIITGVNTKPNGNKFGQRPFDRNTLGRGKFDRGNVYKCGRDKCDS